MKAARYLLTGLFLVLISAGAVAYLSPAESDAPCSFASEELLEHGGGLNRCGCHVNRKTGECHCHQPKGCGCSCQAPSCK